MSELDKMLSGDLFDPTDQYLYSQRKKAKLLTNKYNSLSPDDLEKHFQILNKLLNKFDRSSIINRPFYVDYGFNINVGSNTIINFNCTFLDDQTIDIGDNVLIAPDVKIYTASHPISCKQRYLKKQDGSLYVPTYGKPVKIGNYSWVGGGSIILPGVTIGKNVIVGAGSVVTKSLPDNVIAYGNPCKVIKKNI